MTPPALMPTTENDARPEFARPAATPVEEAPGSLPGRCAEAPDAGRRRGGDEDPRRFLRAGSPGALLERWVSGDPLGVRPRVFRYLSRQALFVDADRVHLRALALGAFEASHAPTRGSLDPWLDGLVERATRALLKEDALGDPAAEGAAVEDPAAGACSDLARQLDLDPAWVRRALLALNLRPLEERTAFQDLLLERVSLDEAAGRAGTSATELARRARRALRAGLAGAGTGEPEGDRRREVRP